MTTAEKTTLENLAERVEELEDKAEHTDPKYDWTLACPEWAQSTVHKLHQRKYLRGDEMGQLNLSEDMCRLLVILDRAGVFDK